MISYVVTYSSKSNKEEDLQQELVYSYSEVEEIFNRREWVYFEYVKRAS